MEWAAPSEDMCSGICGQRRLRSACASAQSNQRLHCPLTESVDTIKCINGEQKLGRVLAHAQNEWCESEHFAYARRRFFAWRGPYGPDFTEIICNYGHLINLWILRHSFKRKQLSFVTFCLRSVTPSHFWKEVHYKWKNWLLEGSSLFKRVTRTIWQNYLLW